MKPEIKSMTSNEWLHGLPIAGKTLNQYFKVSSDRLWDVLETSFLIVIAITINLLVGQLL